MMRVIGTELRRSNARTLVILLLAASVVGFASQTDWVRQWLIFTYTQAANLFLMVPLAAAGGAMLGRRERRTGAAEMMNSTGRPRWQRIAPPAAGLAVAVTAVQLLILAVGAVSIGAAGGFVSFGGAVPVLADVTVLVGAAWVGLAVGRAWSSPMVPPALAALALVAQVAATLTESGSRLQSLSLLPQPPNDVWESVNTRAVLGRLALGVGLAVGGLLLAAGAGWLTRTAGIATVIAGLVLVAVVTPPGLYARYQVDTAAQELVCADGTPQVCVTAVRAYELADVTTAARRALALLAKLPQAPTRAVEWRADTIGDGGPDRFWGTQPKIVPDTVLFRLGDYDTPTAADVTASILNGAGTTMNGCEPGDEVATGAAGAWLMGTDSLPLRSVDAIDGERINGQVKATVAALRQLPEQEQIRRVTALRDAANACRNDDLLSILTGGATR